MNPDVEAFKQRIEVDGREFCENLFRETGVKLLACKYAYYVHNNAYLSDLAYDGMERSWQIMGMALGVLTEDEKFPCIDFDPNHPLANEGIALAERLMR